MYSNQSLTIVPCVGKLKRESQPREGGAGLTMRGWR